MPRYPAARWRPVARYQPGGRSCVPMAAWRRYGLHTAVTASSSLYAYFSKPGNATSHFFVDASGDVEQYIDTAYRSTAHLNGNHDTITVETQDIGGPFPKWDTNGSSVPAWTAAQVEALARLGAWLYKTHGVRIQLCPDSRPGSLGFAYHRQGIDPWRVSGGEYWSKARGKVCPGDRRVAQVPVIVSRALQITRGDDDMPTAQEIVAAMAASNDLAASIKRWVHESPLGTSGRSLGTNSIDGNAKLVQLQAAVAALAARSGAPVDLSPVEDLLAEVTNLGAELAATRQLLQEVASGQVTPDSIADELAQRLLGDGQ